MNRLTEQKIKELIKQVIKENKKKSMILTDDKDNKRDK